MIKFFTSIAILLCICPLHGHGQSCTNYNSISEIEIEETTVCSGNCAFIEFTVLTLGPSQNESYNIEVTSTSGYTGYGNADDSGYGTAYICFSSAPGCEPFQEELFLAISCPSDGTILDEDIALGSITVYPQIYVNLEYPGCSSDQNGQAYLYNSYSTIPCSEVITGISGDVLDCSMPAMLIFSFTIFEGSPCEIVFEDNISFLCTNDGVGCTDPEACNYDPEAICDDGSCVVSDPCCPLPLLVPEIGTVCSVTDMICIEFDGDITMIDFSYLFSGVGYVYGYEISRNGNEICYEISYDNYTCAPIEDVVQLQYYCNNGENIILDISTVTVYPYNYNFTPKIRNNNNPCSSSPYLDDPNCGTIESIVDIPPSEDCDAISYGYYNWDVTPDFDISDAPPCFVTSGTIEYNPCLEDCPCDVNYEGIEFSNFNEDVCYTSCYNFSATILTDIGPTNGSYIIELFGSDGSQGSDYINDIGVSSYVPLCFDVVAGCDPINVDVTANVLCEDGITIIEENVIVGTFTVYPQLSIYYEDPGCMPGENGIAYLVSQDGSICSDVIEGTPGEMIDCDNNPRGMLTATFPIFEGTSCENTLYLNRNITCFDYITGCTDPDACNYNPEAECDDGSCITTDPCCPEPILSSIPTSVCADENMICITFDADVSDINYIELSGDNFYGDFYNGNSSSNPNEICFDLSIYSSDCIPVSTQLTLYYQCTNGEYYSIPADEIIVFPNANYFTPQLSNTGNPCSYTPFLSYPSCVNDYDVTDTPPIADCDNPQLGTFDWSVDPGFDITDAPQCFIDAISGSYTYPPCLDSCPCGTNFVSIVAEFAETDLCNNRVFLNYEIETLVGITGESYYIEIIGPNGTVTTSYLSEYSDSRYIYFDVPTGCDPETLDLTMNVYCEDTTTLLQGNIDLGSITLYPNLYIYVENPGCEAGENGIAYLTNQNGDICSEQIIGTAGEIIGCDTSPNGMLQYNFIVFEGSPCEYNISRDIQIPCFDFTTGCTDPEACNYDPLAECDDGSCIPGPCCPSIISVPTVICGGDSEICIEFDQDLSLVAIDNIYFYGGLSNYFTNIISAEGSTLCFEYNQGQYQCSPVEDDITFEYYCSNGEVVVQTLPNHIFYPNPYSYYVEFYNFENACQSYYVDSPFCGLLEIEEIVPELDCDNPQDGIIQWTITPDYDTLSYPDCPILFSRSLPLSPCLESCPCDGVFCSECTDLTINIETLPEVICSNDNTYVDFTVMGNGAISEYYTVEFFINGSYTYGINHYYGQPADYSLRLRYNNESCFPVEEELTYLIRCSFTNEVMFFDTLGSVTIYPDHDYYQPIVINGNVCGQVATVLPPQCGTLIFDQDQVESSCNITDPVTYNWEVIPDFDIDSDVDCLDYVLSGTVTQYPCEQEIGDACYSDCFGAGIVDEECNCIYNAEVTTMSYDGPTEFHVCNNDNLLIELDIEPYVGDNVLLIITDHINVTSYDFLNTSSPSPFVVNLSVRNNYSCEIKTTSIYAQLTCNFTDEILQHIYLGELHVYPDSFNPEIEIIASDCGEVPELFMTTCGDLQITNVVDPINDPDNPMDGYIEYTIYPDFDVTNAPDCISYGPTEGVIIIEPCIEPPACSNSYQSIEVTYSNNVTYCGDGCVNIPFEIIDGGDVDNSSYTFSYDLYNFYDGSIVSGDLNPNQGVFEFCFEDEDCDVTELILSLSVYCDGFLLEENISSGNFIVYPNLSDIDVQVIPAEECGEQPQIINSGCGILLIDNVIPPVNFPDNPVDGVIEYSIYFGFDLNDAPDCYDVDLFSGSVTIPACGPPQCDANNGTISIREN